MMKQFILFSLLLSMTSAYEIFNCTICNDAGPKNCKIPKKVLLQKCNKNSKWISKNYCQLSCYRNGNAYDGDECCIEEDLVKVGRKAQVAASDSNGEFIDLAYNVDKEQQTRTLSLRAIWATEFAKKYAISEMRGYCIPTNHARDTRTVDCTTNQKTQVTSCSCRGGWEKYVYDCWKQCSRYNDEYKEQISYYCYKPCNDNNQVNLHVGCGTSLSDRTCAKSKCHQQVPDFEVSVYEIVRNVVNNDAATQLNTAIRGGRNRVTNAIQRAASKYTSVLMQSQGMRNKTRKFCETQQQQSRAECHRALRNEFEIGVELFLTSSSKMEGGVVQDLANEVDPDGIYGLHPDTFSHDSFSCDITTRIADIPN